MAIDSVGLFDELNTPVHEPEMLSDEPSDPPSLDGSVALEQADAKMQTIRIRILHMRGTRQTGRQRRRVNFRVTRRTPGLQIRVPN
jgi:hypothetical protein